MPPFTVGVALDGAGAHPAAWREADANAHELFTPDHWQALIAVLEAGGVDYVSVEDALVLQSARDAVSAPGESAELGEPGESVAQQQPESGRVAGRLDALLLLSWIAPRTGAIGLIPTVTTTHTEPFHVATALQTLDHVSEGRAGWQLRISPSAAEAAAFGRREAPRIDFTAVAAGADDEALNELLDEAADVAEVASRLWDSWEDDAIIRDVETGRFLDRDRLHRTEFSGPRFSVAGPSIVPRSPQGRLPITLLAHSEPVYRLAARVADVVFVTPESQSELGGASHGRSAAQIVAAVRAAEAEAGRVDRDALRIVADLVVGLDARGAVADAAVADATGAEAGEPAAETGAERLARLDAIGPVLRSDARVVTGSAAEVADVIEAWRAAGVDGVRIRPLAQPRDVRTIAEELVPELRRRGLARPEEDGDPERVSLRERFGLAPAVNRYEAAASDDRAERSSALEAAA
ncbi:MAG: LLM class flavin-dependent oxidoreductase [Leucobacter sp.]